MFKRIDGLRFWCNKILPLVYDDSLSYYETLCKIAEKLNEVINDINEIPQYIADLISDEKLKEIMSALFNNLQEQIASANEGVSKTATEVRTVGELVWLNGELYKITHNMIAGDQYVANSNCEKITIEEWVNNFNTLLENSINNEKEARENADTELQNGINDEKEARENADNELRNGINDEKEARENADNELRNGINDEKEARENADTELSEKIDNNIVYNPSQLVDSNTNIGLKVGTYNVTSNININAQIVVPKGALINIASGFTLTINGSITAGRYPIFIGNGNLVINGETNPVGYPEWFGAVADGIRDCTNAIQKCIDTFTITEFSKGSYLVSDTIKVKVSNKTLKGVGIWNGGSNIVCNNSSTTILQLGTDTQPSQINSFLQDIRVENINITRTSTNWSNGSVGISCRWILRSNLIDVMSQQSSIPFLIRGCVYTRFVRCTAFSATLADGDTTRQYCGFRLTANTSIGAAGGNASLYFESCSSTTGGVIYPQSWSVQCYGDYGVADIYIDKLEANGVNYGIVFVNNNGRNSGHDVIITNCVLDAIGLTGIDLQGFTFGTVTVANNYIALGSPGLTTSGNTQSCINLVGCVNISISNNQLIGSVATESAVIGIIIGSSHLINCVGNNIYEMVYSHLLNGSLLCTLQDNCFNSQRSTQYLVNIESGTKYKIACNVHSKGQNGVRLNSGVSECEIDTTCIDQTDISNRVIIGGNVPTSNGYFNNNYVTGYFVETQ